MEWAFFVVFSVKAHILPKFDRYFYGKRYLCVEIHKLPVENSCADTIKKNSKEIT